MATATSIWACLATGRAPLDRVILINHGQFDLVMEDIDCVSSLGCDSGAVRRQMARRRFAKVSRSRDHGEDDPSLACWTWPEAH